MNKLKEEILDKFGVNHFYKDFGATIKERVIYCKPEEIIDWINQNYISKEQILKLDCLKDEKELKENPYNPSLAQSIGLTPDEFLEEMNQMFKYKNQLRKEIKEEITKDLFKDFKQVSNPLDEDYE